MTRPSLQIKTNEENNIDFSLSVSGIQGSEPDVRFVVEGADYAASFPCSRSSDGWNVIIPKMPLTEAAGFKVEVIVDGYYFVPVEGDVDLVSPPKVAVQEGFASTATTKPTVEATFSAAPAPKAEKKLVESFEKPAEISRRIAGTAKVFRSAADVLSEMENPTPEQIDKILGLVKKTVASVEVQIYV